MTLYCSHFDRDFLALVCSLGGEDVGNFSVGRGLPADGTLYSPLSIANTVLLHNDRNTLVAEAVSTGEHGPLPNTNTLTHTVPYKDMTAFQTSKSLLKV